MHIWRTGVVAALLAGVAAAPGTAAAELDPDCWQHVRVATGQDSNGDPTYGWQLRDVCDTAGDAGHGSGGGTFTCHHDTLGEVPCHDPAWGWWSNSEQCYVRLLQPQPPRGDPLWEGYAPADGAVYQFHCPGAGSAPTSGGNPRGGQQPWTVHTGFLAEPPGLPSVAQLAQQAMASLPLAGADIRTAPAPEGAGLVGLPVWLWTANAARTWGPVSVSVPGPGVTVTAHGVATQIAWDVGDGGRVVCEGPGEPYRPEYDVNAPDCGHVYSVPSRTLPDGRYPITATTTWHVQWWVEPQGSGAAGEEYFFRESTSSLRIAELHVLTS